MPYGSFDWGRGEGVEDGGRARDAFERARESDTDCEDRVLDGPASGEKGSKG